MYPHGELVVRLLRFRMRQHRPLLQVVSLRFFFSSRRRHTRLVSDWSSDVCSSDLSAGRMATVEWEGTIPTLYLQNPEGSGRVRVHFDSVTNDILGNRTDIIVADTTLRSEERRVGKECRTRWTPDE